MTLLIAACVQDPNGAGQDNPEQLGSLSGTIVNTAPLPPIEKKSKEDLTQADFASTPTPASSSHILHETDEHIQTLAAIPTIRNSLEARQQNKAMGVPSQAELISSSSPVTVNRDKYGDIVANPVRLVSEFPVSTFSIDVDTGSYAVVRRHINGGVLPPSDAVRIEELVNYFNYHYKIPQDKEAPFSISTEIAPTPWNPNTHLLQVGLQGYESAQPRSAANLVFLLDVSGSMSSADKLPLLKNAFRLLVNKLNGDDRVTIVVYAGSSGVVLESTSGDSKGDILAALDKLEAGGSTHGSSGIQLAYSMAEQAFIKDGINRVILATDGDFNVGTVSHDALIDLIEQKKSQGIALTTLGFGSGNYNDYLMEQLADHGDGNYAYIDNLNEAKKVLVEQISSTLETIARDVKIQIEWNPKLVSEYRLIGYENRVLQREDFNNDKVDAGDIGAGHTVTALYEITLSNSSQPRIDPLRYEATKVVAEGHQSELAFVKLRYKKPDEMNSRLVELPLLKKQIKTDFNDSSDSLQFASAVAAYGDLLRGGKSVGDFTYSDVLQLARAGRGQDDHGYRAEFLKLVELTDLLDSRS
jgi:Ca-activated chloride channel family protein